jgi:hypothetical protein
MRKTRKLNKRYRKTRRNKSGGGNENVKSLPPLPASPPASPSAPRRNLPVNKGITVNVEPKPIQKDTHNYYARREQIKRLNNVRRAKPLSYINRIMGKKTLPPVPLDANGYPIKSYFTANNRGFKNA